MGLKAWWLQNVVSKELVVFLHLIQNIRYGVLNGFYSKKPDYGFYIGMPDKGFSTNYCYNQQINLHNLFT